MQDIRNIAIIAHVDHGKTTLVDKIIDQAHILDERKVRTDLLLDNNDLECERGIIFDPLVDSVAGHHPD